MLETRSRSSQGCGCEIIMPGGELGAFRVRVEAQSQCLRQLLSTLFTTKYMKDLYDLDILFKESHPRFGSLISQSNLI